MQETGTKDIEKVTRNFDKRKNDKNIEETKYLTSIPGYSKKINDIRKNENWKENEEYNLEEEW